MSAPLILEVDRVEAGYGQIRVLHSVSLSVREGSIAAVLGSNGAGKTTLMRTIAGLLPPRGGRLIYAGREATQLSAAARVAAGIALVAPDQAGFGAAPARGRWPGPPRRGGGPARVVGRLPRGDSPGEHNL